MACQVSSELLVNSGKTTYYIPSSQCILCQSASEQEIEYKAYLPIRPYLRRQLRHLLNSNRPVNQKQIHITHPKILQRVLQRPPNILIAMQMIPHLGRDKQVLPLTRWVLFQEFANRLADFVLVAVEPGAFEMAIANF